MAQWVPWYAKINFFNKIIYFDWYLPGGMGQLDTTISGAGTGNGLPSQTQNIFALYAGTGHIYHLNESFDCASRFYGGVLQSSITRECGE